MKRLILTIGIALAGAAVLPTAAQAGFGIGDFDVTFNDADGTPATKAGSHPFAASISLGVNVDGEGAPEGQLRNLFLEQVSGLLGDTTAYPRCVVSVFLDPDENGLSACPLEAEVGVAAVSANAPGTWQTVPVFNLAPSPGVPMLLGFTAFGTSTMIDVGLSPDPPDNAAATTRDVSDAIEFLAAKTQLWGDPSDPAHDELRGACGMEEITLPPGEEFEFEGSGKSCPVARRHKPLLTLPTSCEEPLVSSFDALSWEGALDAGYIFTHDLADHPQPLTGCGSLGFNPSFAIESTTQAAQSPTGLDFDLGVFDEGLTSVADRSESRIREVVVLLPEGMTAKPPQGTGPEVCSETDLASETLAAAPGEGCPEASKIGTVEVDSPLIEAPLGGSLFAAKPYENPLDSLLAFYVVAKNSELGIIVKQAVGVEPDPETGQLIAFAEDIPPTAAFSHFKLHLKGGGGSPLVSPPHCGAYEVITEAIPWSGTAPTLATSAFPIVTGPDGGPCPQDSPLPGLAASPVNNVPGAAARPGKLRCPKGKRKAHRKGKARCAKKRRHSGERKGHRRHNH